MERNSTLEHFRDMGMPTKKVGLLKIRKVERAKSKIINRIDSGKSSVRKASGADNATKKVSNNRMQNGGMISTRRLYKGFEIPKQDKKAFSLQYKKDTSKDPAKKRKVEAGAKLDIKGMGQMQNKAPIPARKGLLKK